MGHLLLGRRRVGSLILATFLIGVAVLVAVVLITGRGGLIHAFPDGFFDPRDPLSGNYLLNAEYTFGNQHPDLASARPTEDRGTNLLMSSVTQLLGMGLDYYLTRISAQLVRGKGQANS